MNTYKRHRPSDIISYAVWLYHRFNLSHQDIEGLLAERGIIVSREEFVSGALNSAPVTHSDSSESIMGTGIPCTLMKGTDNLTR